MEDLNRYEYNVKILKKIAKYIDENPQQRFIQALWNIGIISRKGYHDEYPIIEDRFYEEPKETFKKMLDF